MLREKLVNALEWTEAVNDGFSEQGNIWNKVVFCLGEQKADM